MKWAKSKRAFSLVELVIVVVIIGVIAAIAVPRISRGARGAGDSSAKYNLALLRNSIDMYAAEHVGDFPGAKIAGEDAAGTQEAFVAQLVKFTNKSGDPADARDASTGHIYGPYLRKGMPPCPVGPNKGDTEISMAATGPAVAGTEGWAYNYDTGDIIINTDATGEDNVAYSSL